MPRMSTRPPSSAPPTAKAGFSAIELMVVLSILGILSALAAPAMSDLIARWRTNAVAEQVTAALTLARVEAIRRSGNVVVQKSSSSYSGSTNNCSTNQQWSCGFIVYADIDRNGTQDATDVILREIDVPSGISLLNMSGASNAALTFNRWGLGNQGLNALHFRIRKIGLTDADKSVCVSSGGRIRTVNSLDCPTS